MQEAADVGDAVGAGAVADGDFYDLEIGFGGPEDQVEIAEGIELAEVVPVGGDYPLDCLGRVVVAIAVDEDRFSAGYR